MWGAAWGTEIFAFFKSFHVMPLLLVLGPHLDPKLQGGGGEDCYWVFD